MFNVFQPRHNCKQRNVNNYIKLLYKIITKYSKLIFHSVLNRAS